MLKAEKIDLALLEAKYGFVTPQKVLQALQRDAIQDKPDIFQEDIYERPMVEVTSTLNQNKIIKNCIMVSVAVINQHRSLDIYVFSVLPPQLDKLVEKQKETHRRMLEQLLMVEQSHKQALYKLEDEKRNHGEFMKKSDEFTNLLEQERERSVC